MRIASIFIIVTVMGISGCSSQKKLVAEAPFDVLSPSCTPIIGGREESGMGFKLEIPLDKSTVSGISFNEVYFRGHVLPSGTEVNDEEYIITCSYNKVVGKPDIIMDSDPYEEVGNQPPTLDKGNKEKFPFTLEADEAVLSYTHSGSDKIKYLKVSGIKDKPARIYSTKPPQ